MYSRPPSSPGDDAPLIGERAERTRAATKGGDDPPFAARLVRRLRSRSDPPRRRAATCRHNANGNRRWAGRRGESFY